MSLRKVSKEYLEEILNSVSITKSWEWVLPEIERLKLPEEIGNGGINTGDRRALFYLVSAFAPNSVLEVGTHIGFSTIHIAMALRTLFGYTRNSCTFHTVDIKDVNDQDSKPWIKHGLSSSPEDMVSRNQCRFTKFIHCNSIDHLSEYHAGYDFMFLDGSHKKEVLVEDIPLALTKLNDKGVIVLHDYFPNGDSLWENKKPITGPYEAIKDLSKLFNIEAIPLGNLPWKTKLDSNVTSLAILSPLS